MRILSALLLCLPLWLACASVPALAQDAGAPCGRDAMGQPLACEREPRTAESECLVTGRIEVCLPYHRNACQAYGFPAACAAYGLGQNCAGGDPNKCNLYVALLRANTACALDRDQNACQFIHNQGF